METEKGTWIVKSTRDGFVEQVEINNTSLVAVYTFPQTAIRELSFIPVQQFCGQRTVEDETFL